MATELNEETIQQIEAVANQMGESLAVPIKGLLVAMMNDIQAERRMIHQTVENMKTTLQANLNERNAEVERGMSDHADMMRGEIKQAADAMQEAAKKHTDSAVHMATVDTDGLLKQAAGQADGALTEWGKARDAEWKKFMEDNETFVKQQVAQHVRNYQGHEKRIKALEGKAKK